MGDEKSQKSEKKDFLTRLNQIQIDEIHMKELNDANRLYMKCISGKCPAQNLFNETKKKVSISKKTLDKKLNFVWSDKGRSHRLKSLSDDISELETKIKVANSKPYVYERNNDFKLIEERIKNIQNKEEETEKIKKEIQHLKSQIARLDQKRDELSHQTESEDKFQIHLKKANREKEIMERRVEISRQRESAGTQENRKLCQLLQDMLHERAAFNFYWKSTVGKLSKRRKFLLDMIERSNQAFNQGAEHLENFKSLQIRRSADRERHIAEMIRMDRQIDANEIMNLFMGVKGKYRQMQPLESREIKRREDFKRTYSDRLNFYKTINDNIKEFTGLPDIKDAMNLYAKDENEASQYFVYLNEINKQTETLTANYLKSSKDINQENHENVLKLKTFEERIEDLKEELKNQVEKTVKATENRDTYENEIFMYMNGIKETMDILGCDYSPLEPLLGDYSNITPLNLSKFLSILENRMNEVLSFVYCEQRRDKDIYTKDDSLAVKNVQRHQPELVDVEKVIKTQQCAECGESEDVNRYDDQIVYPLKTEILESNMRQLVMKPEISSRLHNVSECNLPRSGVIAGRRFAE